MGISHSQEDTLCILEFSKHPHLQYITTDTEDEIVEQEERIEYTNPPWELGSESSKTDWKP
ncbi:uncharacterized protein G2W53_036193 [Senna tora]|uniref:Uncharacterized protein n=1 Tax=Senna tora TaxID=362788 RepID=A0A834W4J6_9FABA|nr:uncharacterized protein G2W53_036193 [Senna tora]